MMNMMSLALVAVVAFTYFGGQNVPKVLKDNKQMLLGVFVGVLAGQFLGLRIEGNGNPEGPDEKKCNTAWDKGWKKTCSKCVGDDGSVCETNRQYWINWGCNDKHPC
jgi:hypothetical protein